MFRILQGDFGPVCKYCAKKTSILQVPSQTFSSACLCQGRLLSRNVIRKLFINFEMSRYCAKRGIYMKISSNRINLFSATPPVFAVQSRHIGSVVQTVGKFLRLRYLILTGAIGGGVTLNQKYENFKENLPDFSWIKDYIPDFETSEEISSVMEALKNMVGESFISDLEWFKDFPDKWKGAFPSSDTVSNWMDQVAPDLSLVSPDGLAMGNSVAVQLTGVPDISAVNQVVPATNFVTTSQLSESENKKAIVNKKTEEKKKLENLQTELMHVQIRYQKEIDRLEKENRELRKQMLLKEQKDGKKRSMKKSLIDMYSDVLDELADYDSSYKTQDNLPRVVVVGDQSSGKTSVLEMIAQARIFPRGSGEMMTRSPVKVTLSEGPFHIAQFKDSNKEFDLTKEVDLAALRKEVEVRMKASVENGHTVSSDCISMTVKGPGLQRMVLVDLPGIISTETADMAPDTRDSIKKLVKSYMENPNAIILCIQDGSLDAERSNVTDVVSQMDPNGKRTIFVLTKVDLAESNLYNPKRIKQILEGKLFPMKALGYFAVVTGKGNSNDSIQTIKDYEEIFFRRSRLFKDGVLKPSQMTTQNLSMAVSDIFWKMVKETVEQQTDAFKATRFNLETEWKNTFPMMRELDLDELFEKARGEILDEIINLSQLTPKQWEEVFYNKLWNTTAVHFLENIYLPASQAENPGIFNTTIDIKLKQWADSLLPKKCVQVGWETLHEEFMKLLDRSSESKTHDTIFDQMKMTVKEDSKSRHVWDTKAEESLRVFQISTLDDRSCSDKSQWDMAIKFMEEAATENWKKNEDILKQMTGPSTGEQWLYWMSLNMDHRNRRATKSELEKIIMSNANHKASLSPDELTTVRRNLQTQGVEVDNDHIRETWYYLFRSNFFRKALMTTQQCKKGFYYYQKGYAEAEFECYDVVLFWRLQRMLLTTTNALRQQVMNNEARRLERIIKEVLDDIGDDKGKLKTLITGRRVQLAEELKRVRQIQDKLEEFVQALNKEK